VEEEKYLLEIDRLTRKTSKSILKKERTKKGGKAVEVCGFSGKPVRDTVGLGTEQVAPSTVKKKN